MAKEPATEPTRLSRLTQAVEALVSCAQSPPFPWCLPPQFTMEQWNSLNEWVGELAGAIETAQALAADISGDLAYGIEHPGRFETRLRLALDDMERGITDLVLSLDDSEGPLMPPARWEPEKLRRLSEVLSAVACPPKEKIGGAESANVRPNEPSTSGANRIGEEARLTLGVIERWKQTATAEVDDIDGWRVVEPGDRLHKFWSDPARHQNTEHGSTMPRGFESDTTYLLGWVASNHPKLDPTPLQDVYDAVSAWHGDHNAERVPERRVLVAKLERAMQVVRAVEGSLIRVIRQPAGEAGGLSEWELDRRRLLFLVGEMRLRIEDALSWNQMQGVGKVQDETETLALKLGFSGAPLKLIHHYRGEPGFDKQVAKGDDTTAQVVGFIEHGPLGEQVSIGQIGSLVRVRVGDEDRLQVVDLMIFEQWRADACRNLRAWERAIDGLRSPPQPPDRPDRTASASRGWEATIRSVHELVRAAPERFRDAGEWLDAEYGDDAVRERRRQSQGGETTGHPSAAQMPGVEPGKDTRFWRLNCIGTDWRAEPPDLSMRSLEQPTVWAERVLLYICLVTDRAAGEYAADVTELASLPWEKGVENDLGRGWCDPDDIWDGLAPWDQLVMRAIEIAESEPVSGMIKPTPPVEPEEGDGKPQPAPKLNNAQRRAGESFEWVSAKCPDLTPPEDATRPYCFAQWNYIKDNGCPAYPNDDAGNPQVPSHQTWERYVREHLRSLEGPKRSARTGRPTGRSIVRSTDIEVRSRGSKDSADS